MQTSENSKEIVLLSELEHLRARPHLLIGPVKQTEEKIFLVKEGRIFIETRNVSIGLYKLFNEVLDNALDEAKRMKGKMHEIIVKIDSKKNSVSVKDTGSGFYKGVAINKKSGKSNIETALTMLRAGSNFSNDDINESLIGNNGVGISCCWGLSSNFSVITTNDSHRYEQVWNNDERGEPIITKNNGSIPLGTEITFKPLISIFGHSKWDLDIIKTQLIFKSRLIKKDPIIKDLILEFYWDGVKIPLDSDLYLKDSFSIETPIGEVIVWEKYEGSGSVSFVNSAICTGIHQRIVNEFINDNLEDNLGHHFYDTFISLNIPPKLASFGDQNKTKYVTPREEIEPTISRTVLSKLGAFFKTDLFASIKEKVDARKEEGNIKKLRAEKKKVNLKNSHKYFPASDSHAENLFIVEGLCIDENEKIRIWRDGTLLNIPLKEVSVGDEVITHENRHRTIINKQRKLKECVSITLNDGTCLRQPRSHRYYIFNSITREFSFKRIDEIDLKSDNLVKSNLGNFFGVIEVMRVNKLENSEYPNEILLEDGSRYQFSNSHKYCVYDPNNLSFSLKLGKAIKKGEFFALFETI